MHLLGKAAHTSPQNYKDLDGNMRTFTHVDHDQKTTISVPMGEKIDFNEEKKKYRSRLVEKILSIEAVHCPMILRDFTQTTVTENGLGKIGWNQTMLNDAGVPTDRLQDLWTLASNSANCYENRITP